jgi:hypothetical protein
VGRHEDDSRLPHEALEVENGQIGVFLTSCHLARAQVLERRFSLSEAWGPGAPAKAPEGVGFSTKPPHAIALREPAWAQRGPRRRGSREERRCALSAGDTRAPRSREGAQGLAPHAHRDQASAWGGALPQPGGRGFTTMVREVAGRALAVLSCCRGRGGATGTGEEPGSSSRATGSPVLGSGSSGTLSEPTPMGCPSTSSPGGARPGCSETPGCGFQPPAPMGLPSKPRLDGVPPAPNPLRRHRAGLRASVATWATSAGFLGLPSGGGRLPLRSSHRHPPRPPSTAARRSPPPGGADLGAQSTELANT